MDALFSGLAPSQFWFAARQAPLAAFDSRFAAGPFSFAAAQSHFATLHFVFAAGHFHLASSSLLLKRRDFVRFIVLERMSLTI